MSSLVGRVDHVGRSRECSDGNDSTSCDNGDPKDSEGHSDRLSVLIVESSEEVAVLTQWDHDVGQPSLSLVSSARFTIGAKTVF